MRSWPAGLVLALAVALPALAAPPAPFRTTFENAEFVLSDEPHPPADAAAWGAVRLPHRWSEFRPGAPSRGWYRLSIALPEAPRTAHAVGVAHWRSQWVDFYVNGTLIGSSRDIVSGGVGLGTPVYLTIPPALLRAGRNEIHARMQVIDPLQGLGRLNYGDAREVRRQSLLQLELNFYAQRAFLAMAFAAGLITLFVWYARRSDRVIFWFSVVTLSWALTGALWNALRWLDFPVLSSILLAYVMYGLPVPAVILAMRTADLKWPKLEAALWTLLAVEIAFRAYWPSPWPAVLSTRALLLDSVNAALLLAGAFVILVAPADRLRWSHRVEALALAVMAFFLLYEVLRYVDWVDVETAVVRPYHVPVMLLAIGAAIFERHVSAVRQAERTNIELQRIVEDKAREIEAYHAERQEIVRQRALVEERQRILADMHDGVGASLVGLLRYAQGGQVDARTVEQRAREAMQELRLAVDALEPAEGDLATVLGQLRHRFEPLLVGTSTRLLWDVAELPRVEALEPSAVLSIQRIVLEAISNAMQHAGARSIRLAARPLGVDSIEIRIEDDGAGYRPAQPAGGRGLGTMRERAQALGGSITIASSPDGGTTVTLVLPASLAAPQLSEAGLRTLSSAARATAAAAE